MPSAVYIHINSEPTGSEPPSSIDAGPPSPASSASNPGPSQLAPKHLMPDYSKPCCCPVCTGELDEENGDIEVFASVPDEASLTIIPK